VDGAGADDHDQAVVATGEHVANFAPGGGHEAGLVLIEGQFLHQNCRREERPEVLDAYVVRGKVHGRGEHSATPVRDQLPRAGRVEPSY
jgi:hypothetical protein